MLAAEIKLARNNVVTMDAVLRCLQLIREHGGGYGIIEIKVKDGLAVYAKTVLEEHIADKGVHIA